MIEPVRIGVVGTGTIGRRHAMLAAELGEVTLVGISGLDDGAPALADQVGVPLHTDYRDLIGRGVEGVVVATPNELHLEVAAYFAAQGVQVLVEKPLADTVAAGVELCAVAARHGVHLLVGHHRRFHALVTAAADVVAHRVGRLVATSSMVTMRKPDSYYELAWRRSAAAGPLLVNLVHEVDLLRAVCGEIDRVQSAAGRLVRPFAFDDTAAVLLQYRSGALGTVVVTESTPSPWSWEASAADGMGFHHAGCDHLQFVGTAAALGFPSMTLWSYDPADGEPGWLSPLHRSTIAVAVNDPYREQLAHFARVVRGSEPPRVPGCDGLRSLAVVAAVVEAARTGSAVDVDDVLLDRSR